MHSTNKFLPWKDLVECFKQKTNNVKRGKGNLKHPNVHILSVEAEVSTISPEHF